MIKALDSFSTQKLTELYNYIQIYECGHLPDDFLDSVFITLPKKPKVKECSDFRTISLMSHHIKTFLTIILGRMKNKLNQENGKVIWIPSQQRNKGRNCLFQYFGPKTNGSAHPTPLPFLLTQNPVLSYTGPHTTDL